MRIILAAIFILFSAAGCADIPLKDGELAIGKDTTATVEDGTLAKIKRQF